MAILLAIVAYAALLVFYVGVTVRFLIYIRGDGSPAPGGKQSISSILLAILDIFLLRRLFNANPGIWPGSWVFHISFILVFLGHLRFFFYDVPRWMIVLAQIKPYAGVALIASLAYILIYRLVWERMKYSSIYNLMLTATILLLGLTGLFLAQYFRADITAAKNFMMGIFSFRIIAPPQNWLFPLHFLLAFVVLAFLPTHIFTAPFTTIESRRRQEETEGLLHD
ncbi:MAG: hypothetical protein IBX61_00130 [Thermoleophilia bacterium]|nr:hypothetical protein [Thermoleophilia bacterium]